MSLGAIMENADLTLFVAHSDGCNHADNPGPGRQAHHHARGEIGCRPMGLPHATSRLALVQGIAQEQKLSELFTQRAPCA